MGSPILCQDSMKTWFYRQEWLDGKKQADGWRPPSSVTGNPGDPLGEGGPVVGGLVHNSARQHGDPAAVGGHGGGLAGDLAFGLPAGASIG